MKGLAAAMTAIVLSTTMAFAEDTSTERPPQNGMKLSAILAKVEGRDKFLYVGDAEWSQNGYYTITYYTSDKAKVEINVDPVSGEPK